MNSITQKLLSYANILEKHFYSPMDFSFTVENGQVFITSAKKAKQTDIVYIATMMRLFCEEVIDVEELILELSERRWEDLLNEEVIKNSEELEILFKGLPACRGVAIAFICFSAEEANQLIEDKKPFILCAPEIDSSSELYVYLFSSYCKGVITNRGGMTSHAACLCRGIGITCVTGVGYDDEQLRCQLKNCIVTIDGTNGVVYKGIGKSERVSATLQEIELLKKLLTIIIKNNIISNKTGILVWRLWDTFILHKNYLRYDNTKIIIQNDSYKYKSFNQPSKQETESIIKKLKHIEYADVVTEDLIDFLFSQISKNAPIGCHHLFMRPLIDPIKTISFGNEEDDAHQIKEYTQLTGIEFFNINRFIDNLPDIYNIKVYFLTEWYYDRDNYEDIIKSFENPREGFRIPINYLDFTSPNGEGIVIRNYHVKGLLVIINGTIINEKDLGLLYHLLRRREYYWTWYEDNNTSREELVNYLLMHPFQKDNKLYQLCQEMHFIKKGTLTIVGKSLIGTDVMDKRDLDYILDKVVQRGCNVQVNESNDYFYLLKKKDFKDLIALELYEYYFWDDRHEFDLQLLKSIVDNVCNYFSDPAVIQQVENGLLQALPTAIIVFLLERIDSKLHTLIAEKKDKGDPKNNSWLRIEDNIKKIDKEFSNHDYIKSEDIETIFKVPREEIQPLLKLYGCKCFINKKHTIWIKLGTSEARVREILMSNRFYY